MHSFCFNCGDGFMGLLHIPKLMKS
jgi:hypothetical protein